MTNQTTRHLNIWDRLKRVGILAFRAAIVMLALAGAVSGIPAIADDLSNGSWNTTDASNTSAPPNGWPANMAPNNVEPSARSMMGAIKRWWERSNPSLSTTGSAGAYLITPSNASYPTAYAQGEVICAKANFTAVGNDTLNVNGLGAKAIYQASASGPIKIVAGAIVSGQQFCGSYDSALNSSAGGFQLLSQSSAPNIGNAGGTSLVLTSTVQATQYAGVSGMSGTQSNVINGSTFNAYAVTNSGASDGAWIVRAGFGTAQSATAIFSVEGGQPSGISAVLSNTTAPANGIAFGVSGQNIQVTNNSGSTQNIAWAVSHLN